MKKDYRNGFFFEIYKGSIKEKKERKKLITLPNI